MTVAVLSAGVDTYALLSEPDLSHNSGGTLAVSNAAAVAYVYHPITIPAGATVTSAILRLYTATSWGLTPTLTAQAAAASWGASATTWNVQPGVTGAVTTVTHASAAIADPFDFDVTAALNAQLAAGTVYGFVVKRTDAGASKSFYSHENLAYPPTLTVTYSTTPTAPSSLSPSGGRVVGTSKPTITLNGAADVTAIQVQVDATAGAFMTPEFDTATAYPTGFPTTGNTLDLAVTAYAGAAAATDKTTRARYKNSSGIWSGWSPISHWMFRAQPTVTLTYPSTSSGSQVTSDTPTITATATGTVASYTLAVASAAKPLTTIWRKSVASPTIATALPAGIITDSSQMILTLTVRDTYDREAVAGYPAEAT